MRGFKDKLSDDDIVAVLQYVKSLWPDEIQVRHAMRP
jgi:mono/diheme cytochrome c family protein